MIAYGTNVQYRERESVCAKFMDLQVEFSVKGNAIGGREWLIFSASSPPHPSWRLSCSSPRRVHSVAPPPTGPRPAHCAYGSEAAQLPPDHGTQAAVFLVPESILEARQLCSP